MKKPVTQVRLKNGMKVIPLDVARDEGLRDFYKLLMAQTIFRRLPQTQVTFGIINRTARVPLAKLIELLTCGPARVLGLPGGTLAPGSPADVTVIDLERRSTIEPRSFRSKSRNTPFGGWPVTGGAVLTIVGGKVVFRLPAPTSAAAADAVTS